MALIPYIHYALVLAQTLSFVVWIGFLLFHATILPPLTRKLQGEVRITFNESLYSKESRAIRISGVIAVLAGVLVAMYPKISFGGFVSILGMNGITISTILSLVSLLIAGEAGLANTMGKYRKIANRIIREPIGFIPAHLLALERRITKLSVAEAAITILAFSSVLVF